MRHASTEVDPGGSGLPRVRFRMPASRVNATLIARFVYVAVMTANAAIAAT